MSKCDNCYHIDLCVQNEQSDEQTMCEIEGRDCYLSWEEAEEIMFEYI